jgi:type I restriction enzyme M protein
MSKKVTVVKSSLNTSANEEKDMTSQNKTILKTLFNNCLDILRDNEHLIGDKALRNLAYLLNLKLLEPQLGKELDFDNYDFPFEIYYSEYPKHERTERKKCLLKNVKFSNLSSVNDNDLIDIIQDIWKVMLSVHPTTKNIFIENKWFDIQKLKTFKKLIEKFNSFDFEKIEKDILGEVYELVIKDVMTGKLLGQFFTPPEIKNMMIKLIDPKLKKDGKIETIFDPAMGTGGFLISSLRHIMKQSKEKKINIDWDYISKEGLGGREAEPDTYQLAVSNMLISSGHMFTSLESGDSIRNPITKKYDIVLANPPFGINGLEYDDISSTLRDEYLPIKTKNAVSLFLQAIIYMLKVKGRCAIVLPNGQELFSKSNNAFVAIREYLLRTCDLKEIIHLPSGVFTHTSIQTCVFYFIKKTQQNEALEVEVVNTKTTGKEKNRNYNFTGEYATKKVEFYNYDIVKESKTLLVEVSIDKISNNKFSLNYAEYVEKKEVKLDTSVTMKTLGEICEFNIGGTPLRSKNEYYENGTNLWVSIKELNGGYIYDSIEKITDLGVKNSSVKLFKKDTILFSFKLTIGKTAIVGNPLYTNEAIAGIISNNNKVLDNKYLYYYLSLNDFSNLASGILGNGSLNKKSLEQIQIPVPSLEVQTKIVEYLDFIYEKCNKTSEDKIQQLKKMNEFMLKNQSDAKDNTVKTLGEICEIEKNLKKYDTSYGKSQGKYKFHTGGERTELYVDECDVKELYIIQNRTNGSGKCNLYLDKNFSLAKQTIAYKALNNEENTTKYIYYYLLFNKKIIENGFIGTNHKNISKEYINDIQIPIPSLERQKQIVEYCESNEALIKKLEDDIENNKKQAELYLNKIVNK